MTTRGPRHLYSVSLALELVSRPWALLIVEALLEGPRERSELADALPGIDATTLDQRLGELRDSRLVEGPDRIGGPGRYGLTALGRGLEPSIRALSGWGETVARAGATESQVLPDLLIGIVWRLLRAGQPGDVSETYELRLGKHVLHVDVGEGGIEVRSGPAPKPSVIVEASVEWLCDLAGGDTSLTQKPSGVGMTWSGEGEARGRCARALGF